MAHPQYTIFIVVQPQNTTVHSQYTMVHPQYTMVHPQYTMVHLQCTMVHSYLSQGKHHILKQLPVFGKHSL